MLFMAFMVKKKILCGLKFFLCALCGKEVRLKGPSPQGDLKLSEGSPKLLL